jgi:hypothetical protein
VGCNQLGIDLGPPTLEDIATHKTISEQGFERSVSRRSDKPRARSCTVASSAESPCAFRLPPTSDGRILSKTGGEGLQPGSHEAPSCISAARCRINVAIEGISPAWVRRPSR